MSRHLFLVSGSLDRGIGLDAGSIACYPNIGILTIAAAVRATDPDIEITVMDGSLTPTDDTIAAIERARPDIVGLSVFTPNYAESLRIARAAKEVGAQVVMGNDHATHRALPILNNRPYVDAVFAGDSSLPSFVKYIGGADLRTLPSVFSRDADGYIISVPEETHALDALPWPELDLVDLAPYWENYNARFGKWHTRPMRPLNTQFASGCGWGKARCLYCDIHDLNVKHRRVEVVWPYIRMLQEQYGINMLYEICDSFTSQHGFIHELVQRKPADLNPEWFVYGRAQEIVSGGANLVRLLKELGVVRVNMGIDSGDSNMLQSLRKGNKQGAETNLLAIRMLAEAGIQMHISFVLGSIGETPESLEASVQHAKDLIALGNIATCDPSPLLPLPGAPSWRVFEHPKWGQRFVERFGVQYDQATISAIFGQYLDRDNIPTGQLVHDWVQHFCHCSMEDITHAVTDINIAFTGTPTTRSGFGVEGF